MTAMRNEITMIEKNQIWELTTKLKCKNTNGVKWVYRAKLKSNGSVFKHKERIVVKGYSR